jgi:hypothetical protein
MRTVDWVEPSNTLVMIDQRLLSGDSGWSAMTITAR